MVNEGLNIKHSRVIPLTWTPHRLKITDNGDGTSTIRLVNGVSTIREIAIPSDKVKSLIQMMVSAPIAGGNNEEYVPEDRLELAGWLFN